MIERALVLQGRQAVDHLAGLSASNRGVLKVFVGCGPSRSASRITTAVFDPCGLPLGPPATGGNGCYVWRGVAPGSHTIIAAADGFAAKAAGAVVPETGETEVEVLLDRAAGGIEGRITAASPGAGPPNAVIRVVQAVEIARTVADPSGSFRQTGLGPGAYTIAVHADGYCHVSQGLYIGAGGMAQAEIRLQADPGHISGKILDGTTMLPVEGSAVHVIAADRAVFTTATDALGCFRLPPMAPGRYLLLVHAAGYGQSVQGITLKPGQPATVEMVIWPFRGSLAGTLRDRCTGQPMAGAQLFVRETSGAPVVWVYTDPHGEYRVPDLAEGIYLVSAEAAGFQSAQSSAVVEVDAETRLELAMMPGGGTIEGTITAGERPLAGGTVRILSQDDVPSGTALTDAGGFYSLPGLPPGGYKVIVSADGCLTGKTGATVLAGWRSIASLSMARGESGLTGTVHLKEAPFGASVAAYTHKGLLVARDWLDAAGGFSIQGLAPGSYRLTILAPGYAVAAVEAEAAEGGAEIPSLQLRDCPRSLAGLVHSGERPIGGAVVRVFNLAGAALGHALTAQDGHYRLDGLPPGEILIVCSALEYAALAEVIAVDAQGPDPAEWNIALETTPVRLLALVKDKAGRPVPGAEVRVCNAEGQYLFTLVADDEGLYSLRAWARGAAPWPAGH